MNSELTRKKHPTAKIELNNQITTFIMIHKKQTKQTNKNE